MALSAYSILTLEEGLTALGEVGDVEAWKQDFIIDCINAATEDVENFLNRKVMSRTFTDEIYSIIIDRQVDQYGRVYDVCPQELYLDNSPITALTAIKFDDIALTDITEGTTTGIWWSIASLANAGKIVYEDGWPEGINNIKITYTAGYTVATLPAKIKIFCKELLTWHYSKSNLGDKSLINSQASGSVSAGTGTFRSLEDIYNYFEKGLYPYRRVNG